MKTTKREMLLSVLLCLMPVVLGLILWNRLPERIPTHFNFNNEPDGYSSKWVAVFGLPCFMAAVDLIVLFALKNDPKAKGHSTALTKLMLWLIPAMSILVGSMCLVAGLGKSVNIALITQLLFGIVLIVIGNYLPKCRQNYTMGIRLPWTLNSEDNWNFTHRVGGFVGVIGGIVIIINAFFGNAWLLLAVMLLFVLIPLITSYVYYRRHEGKKQGKK